MDLRKTERVYSRYAGVYDQIFGRFFDESRELAVRGLSLAPEERVLEVGVGTGLSLPLYPTNCHVVGIDVSEGMLQKARERKHRHRLHHVKLLRMDAAHMDFPDDSFDLVMAAYVVTAVPDYRKLMAEMTRVCRPDGRVVMLNHFRNGNRIIAGAEIAISPLCKHIGFRTDLSLDAVLKGTSLTVLRKQRMKPLQWWYLVECSNKKNGVKLPSASEERSAELTRHAERPQSFL